ERRLEAAVRPGRAELVERERDRRGAARGLRLNEAEAGPHLERRHPAQRPVVDLHREPNVAGGLCGVRAERHLARDDGELALEIDPILLGWEGHVLGRREKAM